MKPTSLPPFRMLLCLVAGALFCAQLVAWAASADTGCDCDCPGVAKNICGCKCKEDCEGKDLSCNDPAFIASKPGCGCKKASASLNPSQSPWKANQPLPQRSEKMVAAEKARYQAYQNAVKKTPANAFPEALSLWKSNVSGDVQRMAIVHSLGVTKKVDELDALQFMLQALEAPEAKRKECARLGRGKRAERELAAQRLVLLESNPMLQRISASR